MKLVSILKQILTEKKGDKYDSNCAMLYFDFPKMKEIHNVIAEEDLYTEDGDRTFGLEDEPHITLLFGIDPKVPIDDVKRILDNHQFSPGKIQNVSLFENENYDVLKFDVDKDTSKVLSEINSDLRSLPYKNDFPNYHPHCTIGYIKKGLGQKYVKEFKDKSFDFVPTYAMYSEAGGDKEKIDINLNTDK